MTPLVTKIVLGAAALLLSVNLATAQTTPGTAGTPPPAAATPKAEAPKAAAPKKSAITPKSERTPESLACSAEADKKGLKGKPRKTFRAKCIKDATAAKGPAAAPAKAPAPSTPPAAKKN